MKKIMVNLGGDGGGDSLTITKQCRDIFLKVRHNSAAK